jgi:hypothetical protein
VPQYKIENLSSYISLHFYQAGYDETRRGSHLYQEDKEYCNVKSSMPYAWSDNASEHKLYVQFIIGNLDESPL